MLSDSDFEQTDKEYPKQNQQQLHPTQNFQSSQQILKPNHYYYHSNFKRSFIRGILAFSDLRNIQDTMLMLREICASQCVSPEMLYVWVQSYFVVFKVEQLRQEKNIPEQELIEIIERILVQGLSKRKRVVEGRVIKICMAVFHEVGIKVNAQMWCRQFLRTKLSQEKKFERSIKTEFEIAGCSKNNEIKGNYVQLMEEQSNEFFD